MFWHYLRFFAVAISLFIFSWYYVMCFCGVYINSNKSWFMGVLISIIIDLIFIKLLFIFLLCSLRYLYKKYNYKVYKVLFIIIDKVTFLLL